MSGAEGSQIEFRTDRVSSRQLVSQAWRILWPEYFWIALAICLVGLVVGSAAPMAVLMGPMMCGIFICCFAMMRNERPTFDMLFKGFDMFVDSLVATLIMVGVSFLVMIPVGVLMVGGLFAVGLVGEQAGDGPFEGIMIFFMFGYVVAILVIVVIQMLFVFSYPLIVDYNLSGVDAVKLSARAAWANLGNILRLSILIWLMSICAVILCYLPILLVIPINLLTQALLYRRVFPDHSTDSQQYDPYADPYADPQADPHVNPHADVGGYQLDEGVSETGPGAKSGGDTWE